MAINAFDTRLLIATVNDPTMEAPKQFLLSQYGGSPIATEADAIDIVKNTGDRGLSRFNALGMAANVVGDVGSQVIATVKPPPIREKKILTASDLQKITSASAIYATTPETLQQKQDRIIGTYLQQLKNRVLRREEQMAWSFTTTGLFQYVNDRTAFKVDLGIDSTYLPTLSGTSRWGQSAADIVANLRTWTTRVHQATGSVVKKVLLGTDVVPIFLADANIKALLNNLNYRAGSLLLDVNSNDLGSFAGLLFAQEGELYKNDAGSTVPFLPANGCLMLADSFKIHRMFGLNEEMIDGQRVGDPFFSKSWFEQDPSGQWVLVASRPLPIPEQEGSWLYATVI